MTDYNDGSWYGWNGGECPVHPASVVDARYMCGMVIDSAEAGDLTWDWYGVELVAFRVTKPYREPKEIYVTKHLAWECDEYRIVPRGTTGAVKFREVIE